MASRIMILVVMIYFNICCLKFVAIAFQQLYFKGTVLTACNYNSAIHFILKYIPLPVGLSFS